MFWTIISVYNLYILCPSLLWGGFCCFIKILWYLFWWGGGKYVRTRHYCFPSYIFIELTLGTDFRNNTRALAGVVQWTEHGLRTKGLPVQFPVREHAWIAGQVPSGGHERGNHTLIFLSLSFSLPSPKSKNK